MTHHCLTINPEMKCLLSTFVTTYMMSPPFPPLDISSETVLILTSTVTFVKLHKCVDASSVHNLDYAIQKTKYLQNRKSGILSVESERMSTRSDKCNQSAVIQQRETRDLLPRKIL